jgi:glycine/D-amino acid oxidase-like deaminating enzyme
MDLVSGDPFWQRKNGGLSSYPALHRHLHCDAAVVGGGITGALVADALIQRGVDAVLLEKRDVAGGSTRASTALVQYELDVHLADLAERMGRYRAERAYWACHECIDKMEALVRGMEDDCGFERKESLYLASSAGDAAALKKECEARRRAGIQVEWLDESEIGAHFSFQRPAALLSPQAAQVDPYLLTHRVIARAAARGLQVFGRTQMEEFATTPSGVELRTNLGFWVRARFLIFACGYESVEYLPKKIVDLKSTFALASKPVDGFPGWKNQCLLWETARPYFYMRQTPDSRILIGGHDDTFKNPSKRDALIKSKTEKLTQTFHSLFPAIPLEVACAWAGTFGETKDGIAYIGNVRQQPRCFFACGFGGNGMTYSLLAAEIIADSITGKVHPDAALFGFDR